MAVILVLFVVVTIPLNVNGTGPKLAEHTDWSPSNLLQRVRTSFVQQQAMPEGGGNNLV